MESFRIPLRIVFYHEGGSWFAHCLEFDLIGDGDSKKDAMEMLTTAINIQVAESIRYANKANLFMPADGHFFEMFAAGEDIMEGEIELLGIRAASPAIQSIEARQYPRQVPA